MMKLNVVTKRKYLFNFISGGWNSITASNKREAIKIAKALYEPPLKPGQHIRVCLPVDVKSFRLWTEKEENLLLGLTD